MSNYFHNVLSASGPHYELEHFVTRNIQIRRDVNHSLAGKVPLFALNAMARSLRMRRWIGRMNTGDAALILTVSLRSPTWVGTATVTPFGSRS